MKYPIEFERMPLEPGEIEANIFSIAQDSTGFIWISSSEAIYRYDGYNFKKFTIDNKPVAYGSAMLIVVDSHNNVWVKLKKNTLVKYDPVSDQFIKAIETPNQRIVGMVCIEDTIWLCSKYSRLYKYIPSIMELTCVIDTSQIKYHTNCMIADNKDLWIGCNNGIYKYNSDNGVLNFYCPEIRQNNSLVGRFISLNRDEAGDIWASSHFGSIFKYNREKDIFEHFFTLPGIDWSHPKYEIISSICQDTTSIWLGTTHKGIGFLNRSTKNILFSTESPEMISGISRKNIHRLFIDKSGTIWVGTMRPGLFKQKKRSKFQRFLLPT